MRKSKATGFTIIEVMIVLVIASVILLIVFLAVPALQRNARNLRRRTDAAIIAQAVKQFRLDHGEFPNTLRSSQVADSDFDMANTNDLNTYDTAHLGYYIVTADFGWGHDAGPDTTGDGLIITQTEATSIPDINIDTSRDGNYTDSTDINTESVSIITGETCNSSSTGPGPLERNSVAVLYVIETGSSGSALQCYSN